MTTKQASLPAQGERAKALFGLRRIVRRDDRFLLAFRAMRAFVHFGPWRVIARALIRVVRPVKADLSRGSESKPFLGGSSEEQIARAVEQDGYCLAGPLPLEILGSLRELTDHLPIGEFRHADQASPAVASLVHHEAVLGILRRYFRSEPALLECSIVITDSTDVIECTVGVPLRFRRLAVHEPVRVSDRRFCRDGPACGDQGNAARKVGSRQLPTNDLERRGRAQICRADSHSDGAGRHDDLREHRSIS